MPIGERVGGLGTSVPRLRGTMCVGADWPLLREQSSRQLAPQ